MDHKVNWGIIGCGRIAHSFAKGLKVIPNASLVAAASQTSGKAAAFGKTFNIPKIYDNYQNIVADSEIDVIYIATTHNFHFDQAMLALAHGKHVLCEKAFTINAHQAQKLIERAKQKKLFLMEAMWTRFLPCTIKILELVETKIVGDVVHFQADLCKKFPKDPDDRFFNPNLGGGSLLDLGVYPISFASFIFKNPPLKIMSIAHIGDTGVDEQVSYLFEYDKGETAQLTSSIITVIPPEATIIGTEGYIKVPNFTRPTKFLIFRDSSTPKTIEVPYQSTGLNYEAMEVMKCLSEGRLESDTLPLTQTLETMKLMDRLRSQWNLKYPDELS
jgi:predicted dehydrogenase